MGVKPTYFHIENHHYAAMPVLHLLSCPKMGFFPTGATHYPDKCEIWCDFLSACLFVCHSLE